MSSFSIQYIFRMVDQFTPGANKLAGAAKKMAGSVRAAGQAANAAVGGFQRVASAARTAAASFQHYGNMAIAAARKANQAAKSSVNAWLNGPRKGRGARMDSAGALGAVGIGWWGKGVLQTAKEASAAENRFRSLVDSATPEQMRTMRTEFFKQMRITGEGYPELLDAAGDAAQIVGDAGLARNITVAASGLSKIDTAGKSTKEFAENIAAVVGPGGTFEEVQRITDMLAKQQKLGAATAGGTIEAYKNVVGEKDLRKFDQIEMLTAIGMIKNKAPALEDSQIGNMAKYGLRTLSSPTKDFRKKMAELGLSTKDFETDGAFDIKKTQALFHDMVQTADGLERFKQLFSGKNVLASQFWQYLAGMDPAEFEKYRSQLEDSAGTMLDALKKRTEGLEGALNSLQGSSRESALSFGEFLTPALIDYAGYLESTSNWFSGFVKNMKENYPTFTKIAGAVLIAVGAFSLLALPLAAVAWAFSMLGGGILARGIVGGLVMAAGAIAGVVGEAYKAKGVLGALRTLGMITLRLSLIAVGLYGAYWIYDNWDRLKQYASTPIEFKVLFPEAPEWIQNLMTNVEKGNARHRENAKATQETVRNFFGGITDFPGNAWDYFFGDEKGGGFNFANANIVSGMPDTGAPAGSLPASSIPQAVSVTTSIDPIQIAASQLTVRYEGPIGGPSFVGLSTNAPRGTSTVEGGAAAPAGAR